MFDTRCLKVAAFPPALDAGQAAVARPIDSFETYPGKDSNMLRFSSLTPAAAAAVAIFAGVAVAPPSKAAVPLTAASSATGFDLALNLDGVPQNTGNQLHVAGGAPPAYSTSTSLPSFSKTYNGPAGSSASLVTSSVTSAASSA